MYTKSTISLIGGLLLALEFKHAVVIERFLIIIIQHSCATALYTRCHKTESPFPQQKFSPGEGHPKKDTPSPLEYLFPCAGPQRRSLYTHHKSVVTKSTIKRLIPFILSLILTDSDDL